MPSNTMCKSRSSAIPAVRQAQKSCSAHDYVRHYTEMLVTGTREIHALHKLREIDCPIRVFEDCLTEQVIRKNNFDIYQYMADDLLQKFDAMRRKENIQAQQRLAKNGEHTAHVSFKPEFVELQKMMMEQRKESETNQLFANAVSKTKGSSQCHVSSQITPNSKSSKDRRRLLLPHHLQALLRPPLLQINNYSNL